MINNTDYFVRCTHCGAKNKISVTRLGQNPNCGKCKQQIFSENSPIRSGGIIVSCNACQTNNRIPFSKLGDQPLCGKCKSPIVLNFATQPEPLSLSDQAFKESVLRSPLPVLVNFFSPNCGPCKLLSPTINSIAKDYEGRLKVGNFNIDINQHIPILYQVGATPTLVLFQSGKEVSRLEGYQSFATVTNWIRPYAW